MRGFSLFKVWTLVLLVGVLSHPPTSEAQASQPSGVIQNPLSAKDQICLKLESQWVNAPDPNKLSGAAKRCWNDFFNQTRGIDENKCKTASDEFQKARSALTTACSKAGGVLNGVIRGLGEVDTEGTHLNKCERNIVRCLHCASGTTIDYYGKSIGCGKIGEETDEDDESETSNLTTSLLTSMNGQASAAALAAGNLAGMKLSKKDADAEALTCVPTRAEDLESLKKSVSERKKDLRDQRKELVEAQADLAKAQSDYQQTQNELRGESEALEERLKDRVESIKRKLEAAESKLTETVAKLQAEFDKGQAEIQRIQRQKNQAEMALVEAQANLDRQCHATALKQMDDHRKEQRKLMKKKLYTPGGFNSVLSGSGKSEREKDRARVAGYYNDCRADEAYRSSLESAKRAKAFAIQTADGEIAIIQQGISRIQDAVKQLQTTEREKVNQQALKELQLEQDAYTKRVDALNRKVQLESQRFQQDILNRNQKIALLNSQLADDQNELDDELAQQRMIRARAGSATPGKPGSAEEAIGAFGEVRLKAIAYAAACCIEGGEGSTSDCTRACQINGKSANDAECKLADSKRLESPPEFSGSAK